MAKRLQTTSALAVVVMILVGACGSKQRVAIGGRTPRRPPARRLHPRRPRPRLPSRQPTSAHGGAEPPGRPDRLHRAGPGPDEGRGRQAAVRQQEGLDPVAVDRREAAGFAAAIKDFQAATGIAIQPTASARATRPCSRPASRAASPPDMSQIAQPTARARVRQAEGKVKDIATFVGPDGAAKLKAEFASTIGLTSEGDKIWSIPTKADVKSMIWYPVKAFAAKGYTVPKTWDELVALADKIVADGSHPFCVSAGGPGTATGWELTDWVEEVLAKTEDPQVTADWISHKITFKDPKIKAAFDKVGALLFKHRVPSTAVARPSQHDLKTAMDPMFDGDMATPGCWMQKIPTWYGPGFFPDKRANGGDSEVQDRRRRGHRDLPVPDHLRHLQGRRGLRRLVHGLQGPPGGPRARGVPGHARGPRGLDQDQPAPSRRTSRPRPSGTPATTS